MDRLTPLERELMRSVSALQDGLNTYETGSSSALEDRFTAIETAQSYLDQRLATIEEHQLAMLGRLNEVSRLCGQQMKTYGEQAESLRDALKQFES